MIDNQLKQQLILYAQQYETPDFLANDPSQFMHRFRQENQQEAIAFIASCLSYGSRKQFIPKIDFILSAANSNIDHYIRSGQFTTDFQYGDKRSFYRLYTYHDMHLLFATYQMLMQQYGTMGCMLRTLNIHTASDAIAAICNYFSSQSEPTPAIPKDTQSACKRLCMLLRWMVRTNSPVDLGLWTFISPQSLIMPLDTHVLNQALRLGLVTNRTASMTTALRLTRVACEVFPDDPLRLDFALFGYGVNNTLAQTKI